MIVQRPKSLPLVAAHDRGIARDIAEHDRGKLAGRIRTGRPARIGHLGSPLYSMPRCHGATKAEHLGPYVALFKKGVPFFVAIQRLYRYARPNLRGSSSICRQPNPSDQRLKRKRDSDDKSISPAMSGCYPTRSCDGYDGCIVGVSASAASPSRQNRERPCAEIRLAATG
jgi:hypothetical protein